MKHGHGSLGVSVVSLPSLRVQPLGPLPSFKMLSITPYQLPAGSIADLTLSRILTHPPKAKVWRSRQSGSMWRRTVSSRYGPITFHCLVSRGSVLSIGTLKMEKYVIYCITHSPPPSSL